MALLYTGHKSYLILTHLLFKQMNGKYVRKQLWSYEFDDHFRVQIVLFTDICLYRSILGLLEKYLSSLSFVLSSVLLKFNPFQNLENSTISVLSHCS